MAKVSTRYVCQACGYSTPRWMGKCPECAAFSTFEEEKVVTPAKGKLGRAPSSSPLFATSAQALNSSLAEVEGRGQERLSTQMSEFDRVLGGGVVPGSLVLIGGDPGIGKSTLLIEAAARLAQEYGSALYVSGEESVAQIALRAKRLGLEGDELLLASQTDLQSIEAAIRDQKPQVVVVDSVQTVQHPALDSAPGTLTQVREAATTLQRVAKEEGVAIFLVGHVTKEGNLAGPRALEHIVDAVLQLEGDEHKEFRTLRALKNRFGSTNELGVFEMTERGMASVENPSLLFLSQRPESAPGSAVAAVVEGARPLLVEVQALCAPSYFAAPRRVVTGADYNRVLVVLAVVEKRLGLRLGDMDVYVNVAGGVRVGEPALDLAIALAVVSSLRDMPLPNSVCAFGEIGLAGEVRAVGHAERRANEAARLGFDDLTLPRANASKLDERRLEANLRGVATLGDAVELWLPGALRSRPNADLNANSDGDDSRRGGRNFGGKNGRKKQVPDKNPFAAEDEFAPEM